MKLPASHGRLGLLFLAVHSTSTYVVASNGEPQNTKDTNARRGVRRMRMRDGKVVFWSPRGVAVVYARIYS